MTSKEIAVLPNTSLCAIVRDEEMNPAGGIERFVETIVPHVEEAVVVDTGSLDLTKEILFDLRNKHKNLKVYECLFTSFAQARNVALSYVRKKRALILDADEIIDKEGFANLAVLIKESPKKSISLDFINVYPDGVLKQIGSFVLNPRLIFNPSRAYFVNSFNKFNWEFIKYSPLLEKSFDLTENSLHVINAYDKVEVYHFMPNEQAEDLKLETLYKNKENWAKAPSTLSGFNEWKKYNHVREEFD